MKKQKDYKKDEASRGCLGDTFVEWSYIHSTFLSY
ncbi:hypothetical protein MEPL4_7c00740 [Melissococcus plutonius]|nr:hypothetical protein MEPL_178p000990 [Melissococcus plutonius S1]KMT23603.1 hypothetical protein MEPL2_5c01270 [Melissococcus plutonius]KMT23656.1 hypothetical protein MEPL3_9c00520 [Melissococcus plutonius]KMT24290.1 hypothetical protein MEPL1_10c00420 [Melissococcus plutonius]KMT28116.1 hypothetical protein MEPL4_7c00740 [Melissococcus plutonius]